MLAVWKYCTKEYLKQKIFGMAQIFSLLAGKVFGR